MATAIIGERYALNSAAYHKQSITVEHLLADRGLMLIPQHANTALCRNLIRSA